VTEDLVKEIQQVLDQDYSKQEVDQAAKQVLLELLQTCDRNQISKEGLITEIRAGIRQDYINNVCWANGESKDLDLERMAMIGDKRKKLNQETKTKGSETSEWPVKVVTAELEV
jgi:hypothetical protein